LSRGEIGMLISGENKSPGRATSRSTLSAGRYGRSGGIITSDMRDYRK